MSVRRPTMSDVARRSGVSRAAVSYVLGGRTDKSVSDATRARILAASAELGYVANAAAVSLRRGHSGVVLLVLDSTFTGEVSERTVRRMTEGVRELGYTVLTHILASEEELLDVAVAVQPFSVILLCFVTADTRGRLGELGVEHVVGLPSPMGRPTPADRIAERAIGAAQVAHLAQRGHRRIAYVMPDEKSPRRPVAESRLLGARDECERGSLDPIVVLSCPVDREAVASEVVRVHSEGVTALCAHNDQMGLAVLAAMTDVNLHSPTDLAVIGADNSPESALANPPMTTVKLSDTMEGTVAARWLSQAIEGDASRSPEPGSAVPPPQQQTSAVRNEQSQPTAAALPPILTILRSTT
jgi:DNA-binding LacI/PurR family transcriptional regulator